jgi:hypothetical protein
MLEIPCRVRPVYSPSLIQVAERIVYTKRTIKMFYDPLLNMSVVFTTPESVIAIGGDVDVNDFRALLKERDRNKAIADFSAEMRETARAREVLGGTKGESERGYGVTPTHFTV